MHGKNVANPAGTEKNRLPSDKSLLALCDLGETDYKEIEIDKIIEKSSSSSNKESVREIALYGTSKGVGGRRGGKSPHQHALPPPP